MYVSKYVYGTYVMYMVHAVAQLVRALHYKPESHGFGFRCCHWNLSLT